MTRWLREVRVCLWTAAAFAGLLARRYDDGSHANWIDAAYDAIAAGEDMEQAREKTRANVGSKS